MKKLVPAKYYRGRPGSRFDWPGTRWKCTGSMFVAGVLKDEMLHVVRLRAHGPWMPLTTIHVAKGYFDKHFVEVPRP